MKGYVWLAIVSYMVLAAIPLPLVPSRSAAVSPGAPITTPLEEDKPAETIKILDAAAGVIYTFDERDFLIYTVAAEMPASYHEEALKAQAVATYTYYRREKQQNADNAQLQGAHSTQVPSSFPEGYSPEGLKAAWGEDYDRHLQKVAGAVDSVLGEYLAYEGEPILAVYHGANGGRTETAETVWGTGYAYLQSVVSAGDALLGAQTVMVSREDFAAAFSDAALTENAADWITGEAVCSAAGTVTGLTVGERTFTGQEVRERLGLRSACFSVTHGESGFVFEVKGNGHGVGMSQAGAEAMAQQGFSYREILTHYYEGVEVAK